MQGYFNKINKRTTFIVAQNVLFLLYRLEVVFSDKQSKVVTVKTITCQKSIIKTPEQRLKLLFWIKIKKYQNDINT